MPKGEYLQYGGQAIIEGVMMRSPRFFSIACRAPNGEIVIQTEAIEKTWIGRQKWLKYPFLRGSLALLDSMALGTKAMRFAAAVQTDPKYAKPEEGEEASEPLEAVSASVVESPSPSTAAPVAPGKVQDVAIGGALVVSFAFGLFIFNYLPNLVAESTRGALGQTKGKDYWVTNVISEFVKTIIFFGYIGAIGLLPDIRRVFQFHGAEHKAINALEHDRTLETDACQAESRIHPRCGTSFAIIVLIIGFIVFAFVPRYPLGETASKLLNVTIRIGIELCILPLIAGVSYELLRLAGRFRDQRWVNVAFKPGMWSQLLTTREPETEHIEVAVAALQACLDAEHDHAKPKGDEPEDNVLESAPIPG